MIMITVSSLPPSHQPQTILHHPSLHLTNHRQYYCIIPPSISPTTDNITVSSLPPSHQPPTILHHPSLHLTNHRQYYCIIPPSISPTTDNIASSLPPSHQPQTILLHHPSLHLTNALLSLLLLHCIIPRVAVICFSNIVNDPPRSREINAKSSRVLPNHFEKDSTRSGHQVILEVDNCQGVHLADCSSDPGGRGRGFRICTEYSPYEHTYVYTILH